jgi:FMN reductase
MTASALLDSDLTLGSHDRPVRILGIGGSTRTNSITESVLRAVLAMADDAGAETTLASVRELELPMYNDDVPLHDQPDIVRTFLEKVRAADGLILASPTYHGTVSGALKNVLDFLNVGKGVPRTYFDGRPVGLVAYGGPSALNVVNALSHSVRGLRGMQVPTVVTAAWSSIDKVSATFADDSVRDRAGQMVGEVIRFAGLLRDAEVKTGV